MSAHKNLIGVAAIATLAAGVAGCAQSGSPATPQAARSQAESSCFYFAREEGVLPKEVLSSEAVGADYTVKLRLEDRVGRRFIGTCRYGTANRSLAWAEPLPSGIR